MREILFRGKRADNGQWVYGVPLIGKTSGVFMVWIESVSWYIQGVISIRDVVKQAEVIPETIGQYTGLDDKNGVKIFEGDIVREHVNDYTPIYQNGIYMAYNVDKIDDPYVSTQFNVIWRNGCEVIGNLHDNPELKGETK